MTSSECKVCRRTVAIGMHCAVRIAPNKFITWRECWPCWMADNVTSSPSGTRTDSASMLAGINQTYSPARDNGVAGKLAGRGRGNP